MNRKFRIGVTAVVVVVILGLIVWRIISGRSDDAHAPAEALAIQVVSPKLANWRQTIKASGPVTPWQEVVVSSETGGLQVTQILVDVGAVVTRDQVLARLSDESLRMELREQRAAVSEAAVTLQQAASEHRRARAVEEIGLSKQQVESYAFAERRARAALESAKAQLNTIELRVEQTQIRAPDDGYVSSKTAVLGDVALAGAEMFRLVRHGRVEWRPELDASQLAVVSPDQPVEIQLSNGTKVTGRVRETGPTLSQATGRATVYVSLPEGSAAKPGMFGTGLIFLGLKPALTLPESAVVPRDGRSYVYFVDAQQKVGSRVVQTGRRQDGRVEVLTDIDRDARVVARGGAFLSENALVRIVGEPMAQSGAAP